MGDELPVKAGTVLRYQGAIGIVLHRRQTLDGFDIYGNSVAVEVIYSTLMEKFKMAKDLKYGVWYVKSCDVLKGEEAATAKKEPKLFVEAMLKIDAEAERKAAEERRKADPIASLQIPACLLEPKPETKPVGRTAIRRTPVQVEQTVVKRTPVKKLDFIEKLRQKLKEL